MSELTETRWTRYGKDRVYVRTAEGLDVGHIDLDAFNVKQLPSDVHVTTRKRLLDWFRSLPPTLAPDDVEMIFTQARQSTTWQRLTS